MSLAISSVWILWNVTIQKFNSKFTLHFRFCGCLVMCLSDWLTGEYEENKEMWTKWVNCLCWNEGSSWEYPWTKGALVNIMYLFIYLTWRSKDLFHICINKETILGSVNCYYKKLKYLTGLDVETSSVTFEIEMKSPQILWYQITCLTLCELKT